MSKFVIAITIKDKVKNYVCNTDKEMFELVQNAVNENLIYEVFKAELELVLSNVPVDVVKK